MITIRVPHVVQPEHPGKLECLYSWGPCHQCGRCLSNAETAPVPLPDHRLYALVHDFMSNENFVAAGDDITGAVRTMQFETAAYDASDPDEIDDANQHERDFTTDRHAECLRNNLIGMATHHTEQRLASGAVLEFAFSPH